MKRAAALLFQMHEISQALDVGRNATAPTTEKELWDKYREAEAELHWIIPPAAQTLNSLDHRKPQKGASCQKS
jgi:hypothetical protein